MNFKNTKSAARDQTAGIPGGPLAVLQNQHFLSPAHTAKKEKERAQAIVWAISDDFLGY